MTSRLKRSQIQFELMGDTTLPLAKITPQVSGGENKVFLSCYRCKGMRILISRLPESAESDKSIILVTAIISLVNYLSMCSFVDVTENIEYPSTRRLQSWRFNLEKKMRAFSHVSGAGPTLNFCKVECAPTLMYSRLSDVVRFHT